MPSLLYGRKHFWLTVYIRGDSIKKIHTFLDDRTFEDSESGEEEVREEPYYQESKAEEKKAFE